MKNKTITIGIPSFNEEKNIEIIFKRTQKVIKQHKEYKFKYLFVDNCSTDNTRKKLRSIVRKHKNARAIFLSRNFGPEGSSATIMDNAEGDALITIPSDLQDPPELISKFINKWEKGHSIVIGVYKSTKDKPLTTMLRKTFYKILKNISDTEIPINASGVGLLDKKALLALRSMPEKFRFYRGLRAWIGFNTAEVYYKRQQRIHGKSSYNYFTYLKHAERGLFGFSYLILDLMIYIGFLLVGISFISIVTYILISVLFGNPIKGSITILVSIIFFGGVQMLAISIIGKYIQVIVEEVKNRPMYIINEIVTSKRKE